MTLQQDSVPTPTTDEGRTTRPMTGDEYVESLRDGREVFLYGEKVADVTVHPAFRNAVRMTARLYDAMHDPAKQDVLTAPDRHRQHRRHPHVLPHPAHRRGPQDGPRRDRGVGADDLRLHGTQPRLQGRVPRHPRRELRVLRPLRRQRPALVRGVPGEAALLEPRDRQPAGRPPPRPDEVYDVFMHVEEESDDGLVVSGAKVVATGSAITHYNFLAHYGLPIKKRESRWSAPCPRAPRA